VARAEFTEATKSVVAKRAGYQCSFPTCDRRTVGPGAAANEISSSGVTAHIYSASPGGPRGHGNLTEEELSQPENGIHLCANHAKLVDNNRGRRFSAETLLSYKALQEARVEREQQGLYAPIGWIHGMTIREGPVFANNQSMHFAKMNLIYGNNATGKTAIVEWLSGMFGGSLDRWRQPAWNLHVEVSYLNPEPNTLVFKMDDTGATRFQVNGTSAPFNPILVRVIHPREPQLGGVDDLQLMSAILDVPAGTTSALIDEIHSFAHSHVRNLRFIRSDERYPPEAGDERSYDELQRMVLVADVDGTVPGLIFRALSGREQERMIIEFSTAIARFSGRYAPTVLILDDLVNIIFEGWFDFYSHHFLDASNQFQTFLSLPATKLDLDAIRWHGWEVIRTNGSPPDVTVSQYPRSLGPPQTNT